MINILIADDHPMIQRGLTWLLKENIVGACIHTAFNGQQVYQHLKNDHFDLLILDIHMPFMSFSDFEQIVLLYPKVKVLIHTQLLEEHFATRYFKAGAYGFLNKSADDTDVIYVINRILGGKKHLGDFVIDRIVNSSGGKILGNPLEELSGREYDIVTHIANGLSLSDIATKMNISLSAVSTYKNRAMQKLGVKNLVGIIEMVKQYHG